MPRWAGRPDQGYPWPFAGYEHLPGRSACAAALEAAQRTAAAGPLGHFLSALHRLDVGGLDAPGDEIARADMGVRVPLLHERIDTLASLGLVADPRPLLRLVEEAPLQPPPAAPRLCHGDLHACHLLVDASGVPSGVIDWGDVHLGNPAVDLAIGLGFLPPAGRQPFLEAYGPVDHRAWEFARLRALFYAVGILLYGHDVGDAAMAREASISIGHCVAPP